MHAAEDRYHGDCWSRFFINICPPNIVPSTKTSAAESVKDDGLHHIINMSADKNHIWNAIELYQVYIDNSGSELSHYTLLISLEKHFDELLVLSSQGIASTVIFRSNYAQVLKVAKDSDGEEVSRASDIFSKQVIMECHEIAVDKWSYRTHIDKNVAAKSCSDTVQFLLALKLNQTLPLLLIGNIITCVLQNRSTDLQVALGILLRDSKELLSHFSYDEILKFKHTAAVSVASDLAKHGT